MLATGLMPLTVIPAKAGIQRLAAVRPRKSERHWIPAFAGMTGMKGFRKHPPLTPALSSLLKAAAIHGRSPRAPEGRGRKQRRRVHV